MDKYIAILKKHLPVNAVDAVFDLIRNHHVNLLITRNRKTKYGDFRPAQNGKPRRITVNFDLNPYVFLLTFLHELAHQIVWEKYQRSVKPHGNEWKQAYLDLLQPFLSTDIFPREILDRLSAQGTKIFASANTDLVLTRHLKKHNTPNRMVFLEDLPDDALFKLSDNRIFKKLHKRRKNYLCVQIGNNRNYVFSPVAEVIPVNQQNE
jgi:hypothetical protein